MAAPNSTVRAAGEQEIVIEREDTLYRIRMAGKPIRHEKLVGNLIE